MRVVVKHVRPEGRGGDMRRVGVVFPAYNEERHVAEAVRAALSVGVGRVVCVNDRSTDATGAIVDRLAADEAVEAVHHAVNQGKQAAVKHGLEAILRHAGVEKVAVLDADMQDDPVHLPPVCRPVGHYDVAIGYRGRGDMPAIRRLANALANAPYQLAAVRIHDVQSGYRVYTREVADYLARRLATRGRYTFEHTSMLLFGRLAAERRRDFRIAEVAVPYTYADARSSIRLKDNLQLTWAAIYHAAALARLQR